jgi:hypothetical protein
MNVNKKEYFLRTKEEIKVIAAALLVFSYDIEKKLEESYLKSNETSLLFSLEEITYVRDWFLKLYLEFKDKYEVAEKIDSFLFENAYRVAVTHIALNACNKNFERYEVSNLGTITRKDFYLVIEAFKKFFLKLESK